MLRSPRKGAVLPQSASSAVSPLVRRSLGSLPSSLSHPTSDPPPGRRQLISPQITKWFRKSTPRKLAVTPKKSSTLTLEGKSSSVTRVKRKLCSEPSLGDSQADTQLAVKLELGRLSRENDPKLSPKRQRTEPCSAASVLTPVDSNCDHKASERALDKMTNDVSLASNTAQSSITTTLDTVATSFHSPTVNLPNYVYDPQPRAPVGRHLSPAKRRQSRDWLTQLRLDRQSSSTPGSPPSRSLNHHGHRRHRTTKALKSSPQVSHCDGSAVKPASPAPNAKAVSNFCYRYLFVFFTVFTELCRYLFFLCHFIVIYGDLSVAAFCHLGFLRIQNFNRQWDQRGNMCGRQLTRC